MRYALALAGVAFATQAAAQITFYEGEGFRGRVFTTSKPVSNFERYGFNDRAASVVVDGGRWEVCDDAGFRGRCVVLGRGSYDSLDRMGLKDRVSSVRPASGRGPSQGEAPVPLPAPTYEYRRRPNERTYEATVTSAHAVGGPPERRCWIEREQVGRGEPNVGGAILGGLIGGILGHQIGHGRGQDAATVGGAVAGAAIGSSAGDSGAYGRDVRRCETAYSGPPEYWDVTYVYKGVEHRVQMSAPPGRTIAVNAKGEPRG
ncbi:MAG: beta/gamma crystallin-related protein [Usitatibacter sp.]